MKDTKQEKTKNSEIIWFIKVSILTFILSIFVSFISNNAIENLPIIPAVFILLLVIFLGIVFDIVGVAVTVAKEEEFHAKATKKIKGAKESISLIRNSAKVSNVCADVIGDIAGVLSGAISAMITIKIMQKFNVSFDIQFLASALVASLTVGGKALGKGFARRHSTSIIHILGRIVSIFSKK